MGQTTDHRAVDAQIGQVAVGQHVQLVDRLAIDCAAGTVFLHVLDRSQQTAGDASAGSGVVGVGAYSTASDRLFQQHPTSCSTIIRPVGGSGLRQSLHC